ncbi:MAG: hypothetical protein QW764_04650 [Desulfurococcaceae archaeon]
MVAVDCFWRERGDDSGKDFVCTVQHLSDYKTDVLVVVIKDFMQILYDSSNKYTSNIEYIAIECSYVEVKTSDDKHTIWCVVA